MKTLAFRFSIVAFTCFIAPSVFGGALLVDGGGDNWPMAGGPHGSWSTTGKAVPTQWSVAQNVNIRWRTTLPEGGQGGIAVWGDRLFLTTNKPLPDGTANNHAIGSDIVGYCINANTGEILWKVTLPGTKPMQHSGLFSDASSPTPITDGKYVWFVNASGRMGCYDFDGKSIWERPFESRTRHNAKQCEPMLLGNSLIYVAMRDASDPKRRPMKAKPGVRNSPPEDWPWTFLRAFDKHTGKPIWTADAGTSVHNTPTVGFVDGKPVIFHSRGGGHRPPETPYGYSLTAIGGKQPGASLWDVPFPSGIAYVVSHFDQQHAYCFDKDQLCVLNINNGKETKRISLTNHVDWHRFNEEQQQYVSETNTTFSATGKKPKFHPTNQTNILIGDHCLFMSYTGHCIGRVNVKTGKVEYVQVPIQIEWQNQGSDGNQTGDGAGKPVRQLRWSNHIPSDTHNARGMPVAPDKRAKGDGWGHVTSAPPIAVNGHVIFTTMLGTVYVVNARAETFNDRAIVGINDLGDAGKTWTLSNPAASNGKLYFRTLKDVVCVEKQPGR